MIDIQIDPVFEQTFQAEDILCFAQKTLAFLKLEDREMTVVVMDDDPIQTLNRDYRQIDAPTDVLSFTYNAPDPETGAAYLGDIVISGEKVLQQATQSGHSPLKELCLLLVHGILHLNGHDHADVTEKTRMFALQAEIMQWINPQ